MHIDSMFTKYEVSVCTLDTRSDGSFTHAAWFYPAWTKVHQAVIGIGQSQQYNLQPTLEHIVLSELRLFFRIIGLNPDLISVTLKWFDHVTPWKYNFSIDSMFAKIWNFCLYSWYKVR